MKTIVLGDTHGRNIWKDIVNKEEFDRIIFIGDYFDSFDIEADQQINNFLDICEYKKNGGKEVIMLIGNHDHHYFKNIGNSGTSGYQKTFSILIEEVLEGNKDLLQMAYSMDELLFSHAGVGESWLEQCLEQIPNLKDILPLDTAEKVANFTNNIWQYKPNYFIFNGRDSYGDNMGQTPIWIRPKSLMRDSQDMKKNMIQIVGHTQQKQIDIKGKATGGRYFFIDTLGTSGEYLLITDGKIEART